MIQRNQLFFLCIIFTLLFGFAAGCTADNEKEFRTVSVLVKSAEERIDALDYEYDSSGRIQSQMGAAIVDLNEATLILDVLKPLDDTEQRMIVATTELIQADVVLCEIVETDFLDFKAHIEKSSEYYRTGNTAGWRLELQSGIASLGKVKSRLYLVKLDLNRINRNDLPSEVKGNLAYSKSTVDRFSAFMEDYSKALNSMDLSTRPKEYGPELSVYWVENYLSGPPVPVKNWLIVVDETSQIQKDYYAYWEMKLAKDDMVSVEISTDGAPIDLEIMDKTNFNRYKGSTHQTYDCWGSDSVIRTEYVFVVPKDDTYYIVLDNTIDPEFGAYSRRSVNVNVLISEFC